VGRHSTLNDYDLGLPARLAPLEERRRAIPPAVWVRLQRMSAAVSAVLELRLREVRVFGSYARGQFDDESDVDVLLLVEHLEPGERDRVLDVAVRCSGAGIVLSPLILTVAELDSLRARELILAQDLDREGIPL